MSTLRSFDKEIAQELGTTAPKVRKVIAKMEEILLKKLIFGEEVVLTGIGKFIQAKREERYQHNVNTGKQVLVPKHYKILFKTTPSLDARMKTKKVF